MKELRIDFDDLISGQIQDFEQADKNVIQVTIQLPTGEIVADSSHCVTLRMSRDAMVGLAKHLLKEAYDPDLTKNEFRMWEFFPALPSGATQVLGVCMNPRSCEFKIFEEETAALDELLKREDTLSSLE